MSMDEQIEIRPAARVRGSIRPPGSKSITNRALVCAALGDGRSTLTGALDSDDTRVMIDSLGKLGIQVDTSENRETLIVFGKSGKIPATDADLFIGNSGTTVRFLTAMVSVGNGRYRLDGVERMRQRPIGHLISALRELGVDLHSEFDTDCPPVLVNASGIPGGDIGVRGDISSQFLSGLLMALPCAQSMSTLTMDGPLVSKPYVDMTLKVMESFDVKAETKDFTRFTIPGSQTYRAREYAIEPDASAASYFWAAAAICKSDMTVLGLNKNALQGDVRFCECLQQMGCSVEYGADSIRVQGGALKGIDVDMNHISDTVQTLSAVALFADGPTTIRGVAHNRHKETDRIGDLACELRKFGATVDEREDGLTIHPGELKPAVVETYDDHRMAMSLSLPGLRIPGVIIKDPSCTGKTYPKFFTDLESICEF